MTMPVRQIAYFVPDVRAAATQHAALFGSGPFFVASHIPLRKVLHRGRSAELDHSSAYGQWGEVMVEFVQQNNPGPSAFHDMYPEGSGRQGIHHTALFVDTLPAAIARYEAQGFTTALYAEMNDGFAFAMIDTVAACGHMIELYEATDTLTGFYTFVRQAAADFDGHAPVRDITL
ncbi:VOC family protein [Zoogloea sp.]|uniref:VOC family protein n=1 Tax=Zoogloea sp. TaxID=49181 RepID=UPI0026130761|nr:VOC family protein [Zoogloea sp.]MDD3353817.1 VOC family protein [Zoogloea sp.]